MWPQICVADAYECTREFELAFHCRLVLLLRRISWSGEEFFYRVANHNKPSRRLDRDQVARQHPATAYDEKNIPTDQLIGSNGHVAVEMR